ncbi:MAG: CoA-acylating methylmalonate-semialdehyde dehydrogenase [Pseudomonadota bacterium]|nr:CoA-acylating methylmalonate-semialdehyde dehydrogenase [Pseudomonadota bacterium]
MERHLAATEITGHFVGGKPDGTGSKKLERFDPATGEKIGYVMLADETTVNAAVESSISAFQEWRLVEPAKRAVILRRFCDLVNARAEELCQLITREHGKTLLDSKGELQRGIENIEYATGIAEHLKGEHSKAVGPDIDSWSELSPLGVVVGITPFNFPVMVPLWMFPLAVACGNAFILKPSEKVPTAGYRLAELFSEAGLPDGVFNVLQGDQKTAGWLLKHPDIKAASFVGSTPVAKSIYKASGESGKRVQALGGAKNHAVVLPDADIESATNAIMGAAYGSCGQRCMALSVVVSVGDETADVVADVLTKKVAGLNIGPGMDDLDMGPLNSGPQRDRIVDLIQEGVDQGATILIDGRRHGSYQQPGFYLGGTLFDNVQPGMSIYDEEIFGPVLCLVRVRTASDAMRIINDSQYGNGTCIFTRDGYSARTYANEVEAGMVGINVPLPVPVANHSFGGWKDSRFGDLAAYGPDGVRFYTRRKTITERWASSADGRGIDFAFPGSRPA